uniref:ZP domain-containing protein n=1 Tax=Romanomermis culicivorax TaxID=13658 RepID=A0A915J3F4_ROMCU
MLPTIPIQQTLPMPSCMYTIRKDEIDGEVLRYAKVGDQVVHRWECESDSFGILVHSCYVEDGQGEKVEVVNERGCHRDRFLLGDPTYIEALNMAYRESHIFKFADRVAVRFLCQIKLCLKADGGCLGITPPLCNQTTGSKNGSTFVRNRSKRFIESSVNEPSFRSNGTEALLNARIKSPDDLASVDDQWISLKLGSKQSVCLNNHRFIAFTCSLITIGMFSTFVFLALIAYGCPKKLSR